MISSDLQEAILRTLVAHLAETGQKALEIDYIVEGLERAGISSGKESSVAAIRQLLASSVLKNGQGSKVSLTGTGLVLGMGVTLSDAVESALKNSFMGSSEDT